MGTLLSSQLKNGVIFGDLNNQEFIFVPAGECGASSPVPVYEHGGHVEDITLAEALSLITRRSLKPVTHPRWGAKAF